MATITTISGTRMSRHTYGSYSVERAEREFEQSLERAKKLKENYSVELKGSEKILKIEKRDWSEIWHDYVILDYNNTGTYR